MYIGRGDVFRHGDGLGIDPLDVAGSAVGAVKGLIQGKPGTSDATKLGRNQAAFDAAMAGDATALAYLKARGGLTAPIGGNRFSIGLREGDGGGYVGRWDKPPLIADAKEKAQSVMAAQVVAPDRAMPAGIIQAGIGGSGSPLPILLIGGVVLGAAFLSQKRR